jgi:hypothetical protein
MLLLLAAFLATDLELVLAGIFLVVISNELLKVKYFKSGRRWPPHKLNQQSKQLFLL